jgi:circadian clock protein KaiC
MSINIDLEERYPTGIELIDELLGGGFEAGSLVVVAGHPGSGKTTFASQIAYANCTAGKSVIYISFQEDKGKFTRHMERLGFDFSECEAAGTFSYMRIPVVGEARAARELSNKLSDIVTQYSAQVLIIDSITPFLLALPSEAERRAVLQNFVYEIGRITGGLVVVIAEIPYAGLRTVEKEAFLGGLDFVADAIFMLHHYIHNTFLVREMEIRKIRGVTVETAKIPFFIKAGTGIKVWMPPHLNMVPAPSKKKRIKPLCKRLKEYYEYFHGGEVLFVSYPPDARPITPLIYTLTDALVNNRNLLIVSYSLSPGELIAAIERQLEARLGTKIENLPEKLSKYVKIISINPSSMSPQELYARFMEIVDEHSPDILVVLDVHRILRDLLGERTRSIISILDNIILTLKQKEIFTMITAAYISGIEYNLLSDSSDSIIRYEFIMPEFEEPGTLKPIIYMWKKGKRPAVMGMEEAEQCCREVLDNLQKILM